MSTEIITVDPKEFGLQQSEVATIEQAFLPKIQEREALAQVYETLLTQEISPELAKQAKETRLKLVKVRTGIADIHKSQKSFFLAAGRFVDAWKNKETLPVTQMEEKLDEIENYYANIEKARIEALQIERTQIAAKYTEHIAPSLGLMDEEVWTAYLKGLEVAYNARIEEEKKQEAERVERERKAELNRTRKDKTIRLVEYIENYEAVDFGEMTEDDFMKVVNTAIAKRTAAEAEQARIKAENERLQLEAERKEKELEAERAKQEIERKAIEAKAQKDHEESVRILLAERKAADEKLRIEMEAARKLAAELKAKQDAENAEVAKRNAEILAAEKAKALAEKAPDKEKLTAWVQSVTISTTPQLGNEAQAVATDILSKLEAMKKWALSEINKL